MQNNASSVGTKRSTMREKQLVTNNIFVPASRQVASDDAVLVYDALAIEYDVLTATKH